MLAQSEYKHDTRLHFAFGLCCRNNETRASIANPPNSAQLEGTPTIPQVASGTVQYSEGMRRRTDRQTHTDGRDHYIFRVVYDSREM